MSTARNDKQHCCWGCKDKNFPRSLSAPLFFTDSISGLSCCHVWSMHVLDVKMFIHHTWLYWDSSWPWFHLLFSMFSAIFYLIFFGCSEDVWVWKDTDGKNSLTGTWMRKVVILSWLSLFLSKVNWSIVCQLRTKELSSVVWVVFGLRLQPSENPPLTKKTKQNTCCFVPGCQRWFRPCALCSDWLTCIMQVLPWGLLFCHQRKIHYSFITSA